MQSHSYNKNDYIRYDKPTNQYDDERVLENNVFDFTNLMGITDSAFLETIAFNESDGRISLAYEKLSYIPRAIADRFALSTHTLDLSHNNLKDLSFLANFEQLDTLILDKNEMLNEKSLSYLPSLKILWLNNCGIYQMSKWIYRIQTCCPNIKHLSLIGNPGILSSFNGGSILEHNDYRFFVLSQLPTLQYLDDSIVTNSQRSLAIQHKHAYTMNGEPLKFIEKFGSARFLNLIKSDSERQSSDNTLSTDSSSNNF